MKVYPVARHAEWKVHGSKPCIRELGRGLFEKEAGGLAPATCDNFTFAHEKVRRCAMNDR